MGRPLPGRTKRVFRLDGDLEPRRLDALVLLRAGEVLEVEHRSVPTVEATWLTAGHSDVRGICHLPSQRPQFMSWAAAVASSVHVHAVTRPLHGDSSQRVADTIATLS